MHVLTKLNIIKLKQKLEIQEFYHIISIIQYKHRQKWKKSKIKNDKWKIVTKIN